MYSNSRILHWCEAELIEIEIVILLEKRHFEQYSAGEAINA